jgi:DNA gyrase subunit A
VTRRTEYRLRKTETRAHIIAGFQVALDNLDEFVRIIRAANNREDAKMVLMSKFPLSEQQTVAILELRLYQLTGMERDKIDSEFAELHKIIENYHGILADDCTFPGTLPDAYPWIQKMGCGVWHKIIRYGKALFSEIDSQAL